MMRLANSSLGFVMWFGTTHSFSSLIFVRCLSVCFSSLVCRIVIHIIVCNFLHQE